MGKFFLAVGIMLSGILLLPVTFSLNLKYDSRFRYEGFLTWAWNTFTISFEENMLTIAVGPWKIQQFQPNPEPSKASVPKSRKSRTEFYSRLPHRFDFGRLLAEMATTIRGLFRELHLVGGGNVRFGLADPAMTAWVYAFYTILPHSADKWRIRVEPDFTQTTLAGRIGFQGHFHPGLVLLFLLGRLLAPATRRFLCHQLLHSKKRKESSSDEH